MVENENTVLRAEQIDILKALCAFFVVCIHEPFPGEIGNYFITLARVAVPIFFMITGFFYLDTISQHKIKQQIRKIFCLGVEANFLFFIWEIILKLKKRTSVVFYMRSIFTKKNLLKLLLFNESPWAAHLWYLGAILYVLVIDLVVDQLKCRRLLYYLIPVLLMLDLVFGKYSLLILHREFPYILVRNFMCVGLPYFYIGNLIREKVNFKNLSKKVIQRLICVFVVTAFTERFILVKIGLNTVRDHYISTTLLAICLFMYAFKSNWKNKKLILIGRKYSTGIYIIHPILITLLDKITDRIGIKLIYKCIAPIIVYCVTFIVLVIIQKVKKIIEIK